MSEIKTAPEGWKNRFRRALNTGKMVENFVVAGTMPAIGDDRRSLRIGNTAPCEFEQRGCAHARIFKSCQRGARKYGLAVRAMPSHFQDNIVGKTGKLHSLKFAGIEPQLIDPGEFENRIVVHIHLNQTCNSVAGVEGLFAAAEDFVGVDAICVGETALAGPGNLRHLGRGNAERFEFLDGVITHSSSIEGLCINRVEDAASGEHKAESH